MTTKLNYKHLIGIWILLFLLAFPLFYFVLKFGNPLFGTNDFFQYYNLYKDFDIAATDSPFNMRLISSFIIYCMYKSGLHYNTATAFDVFSLDKAVYFNAVLFNYLCVITTSTILFKIVYKIHNSYLWALISGVLYLLGFGTLFYEIMPITDALSVLLFTLAWQEYIQKNYKIFVWFIFLIFQREYIFLAFMLIAFCDYIKFKNNFFLHVLISSISAFIIYYVLRKTLFYTPTYNHQTDFTYFIKMFTELRFSIWIYFKQTLLTMNLSLLYLFILAYKYYFKIPFNRYFLFLFMLLFIQINIISFAAVFGNNTGRYFYILIPMFIIQIINETKPLIKS